MKNVRKVQVQFDITLPGITEQGRKAAKDIAEACVKFDGGEEKRISETTIDEWRKESERIAGIEDPSQRVEQIFGILAISAAIVRDCQKLARAHLEIATALDTANSQMDLLRRVSTQGLPLPKKPNQDAS
jgi:hypothetical protein